MQTRNLIIFMVLSMLVLMGWQQLMVKVFIKPEEPKPDAKEVEVKKTPLEWPWRGQPTSVQNEVIVRLIAAAGGPESANRLATEMASLLKEPPVEKKVVVQPKPPTPPEKVDEVSLGDGSFFLNVTLSSMGGVARQIILTPFQAADDYGLPMWNLERPDQPLPLVLAPRDQVLSRRNEPAAGQPQVKYDRAAPCYHYQLFHYEQPDDPRPVQTLGDRVWKMVDEQKTPELHQVAFTTDLESHGVRITKIFTLAKGDYHLGLSIKLERIGGNADAKFRYQLTGAHGLPIEGVWYTTIYRNAMFGREDKTGTLWRTLEDSRQIGSWQVGGETLERGERFFRYAGVASQFFASVVVIDDQQKKQDFIERARATVAANLDAPKLKQEFPWAPINPAGGPNEELPFLADMNVRLVSEALDLTDSVEHRFLLYNGPVKVRLLRHMVGREGEVTVAAPLVDHYENTLHLNTLTDYPTPGFFGWFGKTTGLTWLIIKFTNLMHWLLSVLHVVLPYGLAIVALTVMVRGIMFPISRRQAASGKELQEKMAKLGPEMKKLQEKYKDDFQEMNQARLELYRKHNINPFASLGGCFLLLAQMPVFLGLYYCLQESIFFRLDHFLWMPSLSAPDMLLGWGDWLPGISRPQDLGGFIYLGPFLNLLPILTIGLFIVQQKVMMPPPTDEQQEMQQNMMKYMMIFIGIMFYKVAAGLCIYFIASTLWGLAERQLLPKKKEGTEPTRDEDRRGDDKKKSKADPNGDGWKERLSNWWGGVLKEAGKQNQARRADGKKPRG